MDRNSLIASFAAPSVALFSIGLAAGAGFVDRPAYGPPAETFSEDAAAAHAHSMFQRADLDGSGRLEADEYVALTLVTAELARLNGFVPLGDGAGSAIAQLPSAPPSSLSGAERARVEAVARSEFYAAAGADGVLDAAEYHRKEAARFRSADRNRNGALAGKELVSYAAQAALMTRIEA